MSLYYFGAARTDEQLASMIDLEKRQVCIFCPNGIGEAINKPFMTTKYWQVKKNDHPYKGTTLHLVLFPKEHVPTFAKLSPAAQQEFISVVVQCEKKFKLKSYGVAARSGDMRYNGGSVEHLHAHIVVGDTDNPDHEPLKVKLSSRPG